MENTTIIKLGPDTRITNISPVSFEEAFGEHSNLFGKFRAKMATKRASNQEKLTAAKKRIHATKAERGESRQKMKSRKKVAKQVRKGDVKVARQEKKGRKKLARQSRLSDVMRARQNRKTEKSALKAERESSDELPQEELSPEEMEQQGQYESPEMENEGAIEEEPVAETEEGGEEEGGEEIAEEEGGEEMAEGEEEESADGDGYYDNFEDDLNAFDGDENKLTADNTFECVDDSSNADDQDSGREVKFNISPKVFEVARKIEWNKEAVSRLEGSLDGSDADGASLEEIQNHKNRAMELESQMAAYIDGFETESSAAGKPKRMAQAGAAMREARKLRMMARINSEKAKKQEGKNVTEIEQGLNPKIEPGRIEIPPAQSGTDSSADESSADSVSETSEFAGGAKLKTAMGKVNWKGVAIGATIAIIGIWAINKYKPFSK